LDQALLTLENRWARKIFVFHSIHTRPGSDVIRTGNRALLNSMDQADALVVLTPQQRTDVAERFGHAERIHVIPHAAQPPPPAPPSGRTPGKVVVVSRLAPEKDVGAAIEAFGEVSRALPRARLEIWGSGPEEGQLKALTRELGLEGSVRFAGYTDNVPAVFQSAECSVLTSRWEGFSLTVVESLASGTPCIAFDVKYGPAAMIADGVNGYLVAPGDRGELARRIIGFLEAPAQVRQAMSEAAAARMAEFSEATLADRWQTLFDALVRPVASRPPLHKRLWRRVPPGPRNALARWLRL
jgi:poly(glycerol-phosphate) alpha-glucosyltransferase